VARTSPAIIFAGGDLVPDEIRPLLPQGALVIAADSGLHSAQRLGLAVDLVVGDLDSADPAAVDRARAAGAAVEQHPPDKDATDLELALEAALDRRLGPVTVVGGAGFGRIDHFLGNAQVIGSPRFASLHIRWRVKGATVIPVHDRAEICGSPGDTITLLATGGPAINVVTNGLLWHLEGDTLEPGSTRGVSNEMTTDRATISLAKGVLLAIHHRRDS
jgi:thiamine pyrophosphokinase